MDDAEAGLHPLDVDQRRKPDGAVAVELERPITGGGEKLRSQLADRGWGVSRPPGSLRYRRSMLSQSANSAARCA